MQSVLQMSRTTDPASITEQGLADYEKLSITERAKMLKALQRAVHDVERSLETHRSDKDVHSVTDDSAVDVTEINDFIGTKTKSGVTKVTSALDTSNDHLQRFAPKFRKSDLNTMAVVGLKGDNIMYINVKRDSALAESTWSIFSHIPHDANIDIRKAVHFFPYKGHFYMSVGTEVWRKYHKIQDHFEAELPDQYINEWERVGDEVFPSEYLRSVVPFVKVVGEDIQFHLILLNEEGRLFVLRGGFTASNEFVELKDAKRAGIKFKKLVYGDEHIVAYDAEHNIWHLTPDFTHYTFTVHEKKHVEPLYELTAVDSGLVGVRRDGWLYRQVRAAHGINGHGSEWPKTWEKWIRQNGILHLGMVSPDANLGLEKVAEPLKHTRLNGDGVAVVPGTSSFEIQTTQTVPKTETTTVQNSIIQKEVETLLRTLPIGRIARRRHGVRGLERLLRELQLLVEEDEEDFEDTYDDTLGRLWKQGLGLTGQKKGEDIISDKLDNGNLSRGIIKRSEDGRSRYLAVFNQSNLVIAAEDDHRPVEVEPKTVDRVIVVSPPSETFQRCIEKHDVIKEDSFIEIEKPEVETKTTEKVTTNSTVEVVEGVKSDVVESKTIVQETVVEPVPEVRLISVLEKTTANPIVTSGWFLRQTIQSFLDLQSITLAFPLDVVYVSGLKTLVVQGRDEFVALVNLIFDVAVAFEEWTRRIQEITITEADRIQVNHYDKALGSSKVAVDKAGLVSKVVAQLGQAARSQIIEVEKDVLILENKLRALGHELQDIKHQVWVPSWLRELHGQKQLGDTFNAGASEANIEAEMKDLKVKISQFAQAREICAQWVDVSQAWLQLCGQVSANLGRVYEMLFAATFKLDDTNAGHVCYKAILLTEWHQIRREAEETARLLRSGPGSSSRTTTVTTNATTNSVTSPVIVNPLPINTVTTQVETVRTVRNGRVQPTLDESLVKVVSPQPTLFQQLEVQSSSSRTIVDLLAKLGSVKGATDIVAYIDSQDRSRVTVAAIIENVRSIYQRLAATNHETVDQIHTIAQLQTLRSRQASQGKVTSHAFLKSTLNNVSRAHNYSIGGKDVAQGVSGRHEASLEKIRGYIAHLKAKLAENEVQIDISRNQKIGFVVVTLEGVEKSLQELLASITRVSELLIEMKKRCERHVSQLDSAAPLSFDNSHASEVDAEWQRVESACEKWLDVFNDEGISPLSYKEF